MKWIAIAAMSENRVIGKGNELPWRLPDEFRWFKSATNGKVLMMGRKTYESIGRPLPGRRTFVLTRGADPLPGVTLVHDLADIEHLAEAPELWVCGGGEIYRQTLPRWDEVYLTTVKRVVEGGDAFFPPFEDAFEAGEMVRETPDFRVVHYVRHLRSPDE